MANALSIVYGSTTLNLNSGDYSIIDYVPAPGDGHITYDRIRLRIQATSYANLQTDIQALHKAIEAAHYRYDSGIGDRVFLKFLPDGLTNTYRSEIVRPQNGTEAGRVELQPMQFGWRWRKKYADVLLLLTRWDYWEADSETELSLRNNSGSGTGGIGIINMHGAATLTGTTYSFVASTKKINDSANGLGAFSAYDMLLLSGSTSNDGCYTVASVAGDGSYLVVNEKLTDEDAGDTINIYDVYNFVDITGSTVTGTLPAPIELRVENTYNNSSGIGIFWAGENWRTNPFSLPYVLECEELAAATSNAAASSGYYQAATVTIAEGWNSFILIKDEHVAKFKGGYYRLMMKFLDETDITNCEYEVTLSTQLPVTLWESGRFSFDFTYTVQEQELVELCTIQVPPFINESLATDTLRINFYAYSMTGAEETIKLDYMLFMPLDGWRKLVSTNDVELGVILVDDGIDNMIYQINTDSEILTDISAEGTPLMVVPGKDTRLVFQMHGYTDNECTIDRTAEVRAYYRPRVRLI